MNEQRQHYRKSLRLTGYVVREQGEQAFQLLDLSTGGMKAHFEDNPDLLIEHRVDLRLPGLRLVGSGVPVRIARAPGGGFEVGFDFVALDGVDGNGYRYRSDQVSA